MTISSIYYIALTVLIVASGILGLLFLVQHTPNKTSLRNYRLARRLMACAYLCLSIGKCPEFLHHFTQIGGENIGSNMLFSQIITLAVAVSQAFLFTLTCLLLIDTKSISFLRVKSEIIVIVFYIVAMVASYIVFPKPIVEGLVYVYIGLYFIALTYFTFRFIRQYRYFRLMIDNYYSDDLAARLRWIAISFYGALGIGVFALITVQYMTLSLRVAFVLAALCVYLHFAIRLLNYQWQFSQVEAAMEVDLSEKSPKENIVPPIYRDLEEKVGRWEIDRGYTVHGVTINNLALSLGTNRSYLSSYINRVRGCTFRDWINALRIDYAKHLMLENPSMLITEVAERTGFSDKSNFINRFSTIEGISPAVWRKEHRM